MADEPTQTVCFDACPNRECREAAREVAVMDARLTSFQQRVEEWKESTETRISNLHRDMNAFHTAQSETNGTLVGSSNEVLKKVDQLSRILIEGNGTASVLNRLSDVEHHCEQVASGLGNHVTHCDERHKSRANLGLNVLQVAGAILAAVLGGAITYFVGH